MTDNKTRKHGSMLNASTIGRPEAQARVDFFMNSPKNKKEIIKKHLAGNEQVSVKFSLFAFLSLLETLQSTQGVTGVRVYFACYTKSKTGNATVDANNDRVRIPKGKEGYITLLFATTHDNGTTDLKDELDFYAIDAKGTYIIQLELSEAANWVKEYKKSGGIWDKLSKAEPQLSNGDTKSLWYSIATIKATYDDIILSHMNDTKEITVFFATYPPNLPLENFDFGHYTGNQPYDASNQLTLIFGTGSVPFEGYHPSLPSQKWEKLLDPTDYDTGAPCPPNVGCNGSSL